MLEWAIERQDAVDKDAWNGAFGVGSPDGSIEGISEMVTQLHIALQQLTTGEAF